MTVSAAGPSRWAYVGEPFVHDIFVSYSHGDPDGIGDSKLELWSHAFVKELESEFRAYRELGADVRIFLDEHRSAAQSVDPLSPLASQLRASVERSALLTVLMSPYYLASEWCRLEREWWSEKQRELTLTPDGRIAVARIWPTDQIWPAPLVDDRGDQLFGFSFFDATRPQPFEWPKPSADSKGPFREELLALVGRLVLKLKETRQRLDEQRLARASVARLTAPGPAIYLHARAENRAAWARAFDALSANGVAVVPGEPDALSTDVKRKQEIRRQRIGIMGGCDAVLILTGANGWNVDEDMVTVGRIDRNSARAQSNRPLPCAVLDVTGAAVATPERKQAARNLNIEWIDATVVGWPSAVRQWLSDIAAIEACA